MSHIFEIPSISIKIPNVSIKIPSISIEILGILIRKFETLGFSHREFKILGISSEIPSISKKGVKSRVFTEFYVCPPESDSVVPTNT